MRVWISTSNGKVFSRGWFQPRTSGSSFHCLAVLSKGVTGFSGWSLVHIPEAPSPVRNARDAKSCHDRSRVVACDAQAPIVAYFQKNRALGIARKPAETRTLSRYRCFFAIDFRRGAVPK
jgi:hypothetical protein